MNDPPQDATELFKNIRQSTSVELRLGASSLPGLTKDEMARYGRHLVLHEIGIEGQRRLKASSVLVVGVGGLGTPAATYLVAAGVGRVGLVDGDVIEKTNLHRQVLFTESDVGKKKVLVAKSRLLKTNPNVKIEAIPVRLDSSNALELFSRFDLVVDATDNLPSRYLISDACVLLGKPDVFASALGFDGQASVFYSREGPCYRCFYPQPPPPETVESCENAGVLGVVPGIMGSVQAVQAINLLLHNGSPLIGKLLVFSGIDSSFVQIRIKKNPDCPVCGSNPTIKKLIDYEQFCGTRRQSDDSNLDIDPVELKESMSHGAKMILLDVREPYEYEICHIRGSKLIPLGELSKRLHELEKDREIVVYCHHGNRSATAMNLLRKEGYTNSRNLKGGIDAWRVRVDPTMRSY